MEVQSITQATCTECGEQEENHRITDRTLDKTGVQYRARCNCGSEVVVHIDQSGIVADGAISYEDASWTGDNQ